jgi:hypothetical protein
MVQRGCVNQERQETEAGAVPAQVLARVSTAK